MLFLTEDNSFRGEDTSISLDEVIEATKVQLSAKPLIMLKSSLRIGCADTQSTPQRLSCLRLRCCLKLYDWLQGMSGVQP